MSLEEFTNTAPSTAMMEPNAQHELQWGGGWSGLATERRSRGSCARRHSRQPQAHATHSPALALVLNGRHSTGLDPVHGRGRGTLHLEGGLGVLAAAGAAATHALGQELGVREVRKGVDAQAGE